MGTKRRQTPAESDLPLDDDIKYILIYSDHFWALYSMDPRWGRAQQGSSKGCNWPLVMSSIADIVVLVHWTGGDFFSFYFNCSKKRNQTPFREFVHIETETHSGLNSIESQVLKLLGSVGNPLTFSQKFHGWGAHDLMWMISVLEFLYSNFCWRLSQFFMFINLGNFFFSS